MEIKSLKKMQTALTIEEKNSQVTKLVGAIGNAIKEAGAISSGNLYATLSQFGCSIEQHENLIEGFKKARKIKEVDNLLYWID